MLRHCQHASQVLSPGALQELFKATSGPGIQAEVRRDATAPFISGHFEYGLGRAAAKRNVFVFVGRSQDHESLHLNTNVTFLGVFLTDGSVGPLQAP